MFVVLKWSERKMKEKLVEMKNIYPIIKLSLGIFVILLLSNIAYLLGEDIGRFVYILSH